MQKLKKEFRIVHVDQWQNAWVECPICSLPFLADGIMKHIRSMSARKAKSPYRQWLKKYNNG